MLNRNDPPNAFPNPVHHEDLPQFIFVGLLQFEYNISILPDLDLELVIFAQDKIRVLKVRDTAGYAFLLMGWLVFSHLLFLIVLFSIYNQPSHLRVDVFLYFFFCLIFCELFLQILDALSNNIVDVSLLNLYQFCHSKEEDLSYQALFIFCIQKILKCIIVCIQWPKHFSELQRVNVCVSQYNQQYVLPDVFSYTVQGLQHPKNILLAEMNLVPARKYLTDQVTQVGKYLKLLSKWFVALNWWIAYCYEHVPNMLHKSFIKDRNSFKFLVNFKK